MTLFDLLLIALVFVSLIVLIVALTQAMRRRWRAAGRLLLMLAASCVAYLCIVVSVSAFAPQRIIPVGLDRCFDEMCFTVENAVTTTQLGPADDSVRAHGVFYVVTIRASNHSLGTAQSEGGLRALLTNNGRKYEVDGTGQRAWELSHGGSARLTARLQPGENVLSVQVFDVPQTSAAPALILSHGITPGYLVIGESPVVREPAIQLLR